MIKKNIDYKKQFRLNPTAMIVDGVVRSLLCDLEKGIHYYIPRALSVILNDKNINNIASAFDSYAKNSENDKTIILEYFYYLIENDLIFFTDYPELYRELNLQYDYPGHISNAIIDIHMDFSYAHRFIDQCEEIMCRAVQVRLFDNNKPEELMNLLRTMDETLVEWVEIIIPHISGYLLEDYINIALSERRIRQLIVYGYEEEGVIWELNGGLVRIVGTYDNIESCKACGIVNEAYFSSTILAFTESTKFNSCLNRKLSIDYKGEIKNCPSMSESFGNIKDTTLAEAIEKPGFKKYWDINKDKIHICKDCEFRYICTDCRAYVEDPDDILSKPLKCGYNPYTGDWQEWSTHPIKQKAIDFYGMRELIVDEHNESGEVII